MIVFFFKQKTAYEMRISDWSSDVCSSDLPPFNPHDLPRDVPIHGTAMGGSLEVRLNDELSQIEETMVVEGVVGYARRPPSIDSNRKSYAIYITGESMEPRYRAGDLVYVDPLSAPSIGTDVIVQLVEDV